MGVLRAQSPEPKSCCVDDSNDRNKDQGRAGETDQTGGLRVQAAPVQMQKPASCDQRSPQVIRKRPGVVAGEVGSPPNRRDHPDDDENDRGARETAVWRAT